MSTHTLNLNPRLYEYFQATSLREPEILKKLRMTTKKMSGAQMQISPEQGQFMAMLVDLLGAKKTLDIGTFTGYSALVVAMNLPPEGRVISCDIDNSATEIAESFWQEANVKDKITLCLGPATDTLQQLIDQGEEGTFDFAFIDADKINYGEYYELSLRLLRPGGLVAIDNVLWDGKVADDQYQDKSTNAIRELNLSLLSDERIRLSMIPIGDGLTLARKC